MNYVVSDSSLTSVADAIRAKGQTSAALEYPDGFVSAIDAIPTGGGGVSVPAKDVNFRDYDGTIVNAYSKAEFIALSAMPANPSHDGLTAQGWNWSLADAKAYVTKYGRLEIGQMYITDDGKTRIYIHLEQGRTSPMLGVCPNGTVDVDWGDGTAHDTLTGTDVDIVKWTQNHHYAAPGDYVIRLSVTGSMGFYGNSSRNTYSGLLRAYQSGFPENRIYQIAIKSVNIGSGVTSIAPYAFYNCNNLESITIPDSVTSIGNDAIRSCYALKNITIPDEVTSLPDNVFYQNYVIANISLPANISSIGAAAFRQCYCVANIATFDITKISSRMLDSCYNITNIIIPDSVTNIELNAFNSCCGVSEIHFKSITPPTLADDSAFGNIPTGIYIYVPTGSLEAYTSAENYPNSRVYQYVEE